MPKKKTESVVKYTFQVHVRPEGPYRLRTLSVVERCRTALALELRECRCPEQRSHLERVHRHWGVDHHFADVETPAALRVAWLEREEDGVWVACAPDVDAGESHSELHRGIELLEKLGNAVKRRLGTRTVTDATFADPRVVVAALRHSRDFVKVERFAAEDRRYWVDADTSSARAEGEAA